MAEGRPRATGVRARQQEERRRRLVQVARELLTEDRPGGFSMVMLAARAEVSLATPYNLFGSKAGILKAVFAADVAGLHRRLGGRAADPVSAVLGSADLLVSAFASRTGYYRALTHSISALGPNEVRRLFAPIAETILQPAVLALDAAGLLLPIVPVERLAAQMARSLEAAFMHWLSLDWEVDRFAEELRLGFGLLLLGVVEADARAQIIAALRPGDDGAEAAAIVVRA